MKHSWCEADGGTDLQSVRADGGTDLQSVRADGGTDFRVYVLTVRMCILFRIQTSRQLLSWPRQYPVQKIPHM